MVLTRLRKILNATEWEQRINGGSLVSGGFWTDVLGKTLFKSCGGEGLAGNNRKRPVPGGEEKKETGKRKKREV